VAYVLVDRRIDTGSPGAPQVQPAESHAFRLEPRAENHEYALYRVIPRQVGRIPRAAGTRECLLEPRRVEARGGSVADRADQ
jgi:hypothetical protein